MAEPIRVLQVVTHMNRGGLETMLMNYYRHFDRGKVQFDFLVHREERADYDDEIEALGGRIYRLPRLIPWSITYRNKLDKFFDQHSEYRIVHVHQDCLSSIVLKSAAKYGVPVRIAHSHSSSQDKDFKYPIKLFFKRFISKYATDLFACGKAAGDWMFGGSDYTIVNNAINAGEYCYDAEKAADVRKKLGIPENAFVLGHVGRFCRVKNHEFLVEVFAEVHKQDPNSVLLLVGDGELKLAIQEKVKKLKLQEKVIFAGVRNDVADILQAMDIFVFPSLYEGLGIAVLEAQAAGLTCIASNEVPDDVVITNLIKQLSLNGSCEIWAAQVLLNRSSLRQKRFQDIARAGFDVKENAEKLQDFYLKQ